MQIKFSKNEKENENTDKRKREGQQLTLTNESPVKRQASVSEKPEF